MPMSQTPSAFPHLSADLDAICDTGGRLTGTPSETKAVALLKTLGRRATGVDPMVQSFAYGGWRALAASLELADGSRHACHPLVRTVPTSSAGLTAEVVDLGRGTEADFAARAGRIPGRIVLVRHELMFSADTVHRRLKYGWAKEYGAAGFLIAGPLRESPVTGSSGRTDGAGIPAAGISLELAERLSAHEGEPIRLRIATEETEATAENLFFDMPGSIDEWIVLSAHIDGHDLAESAMDNATGLAVALSVAGRVRRMEGRRRGVRLAFFNAEEWALTGSRHYIAGLSQRERDAIALNVNLDTVGCGAHLTALTSDFPGIEPLLAEASRASGVPLGIHRPLQRNSDHANFAEAGIPAFRMVSGFDDRTGPTRLLLTKQDVRAHVDRRQIEDAASLAFEIVHLGCLEPRMDAWRTRQQAA